MARCKECLHNGVCGGFIPTDLDRDVFDYCREGRTDEIPDIEERCNSFKGKSRFIELPCMVGDTVYAVGANQIKQCHVYEIILGKDNEVKCVISFDCDDDCDGCYFNSWHQEYSGEWSCDGEYGDWTIKGEDFGKTVFLTRKEAEAALKERENHG